MVEDLELLETTPEDSGPVCVSPAGDPNPGVACEDEVEQALVDAGLLAPVVDNPEPHPLESETPPEVHPILKRFRVVLRHTPEKDKSPVVEAVDEAGAREAVAATLKITDPKLKAALDLNISEES